MSRASELAAQFQAACTAFADYVESLSPEEWLAMAANHPDIRVGDDERRSVGVVAHHVGDVLPMVTEIMRRRATQEAATPLTQADIEAINERHAATNGSPDHAETVAMTRDNGSRAVEVVRGLTDEQLDRAGPGERSAAAMIERILIGHIAWHEGSIRATVGR